jgi:hypothetical protein
MPRRWWIRGVLASRVAGDPRSRATRYSLFEHNSAGVNLASENDEDAPPVRVIGAVVIPETGDTARVVPVPRVAARVCELALSTAARSLTAYGNTRLRATIVVRRLPVGAGCHA